MKEKNLRKILLFIQERSKEGKFKKNLSYFHFKKKK